jgi:YYY domain-containing protein
VIHLFIWWLLVQLLSIIALPFTSTLFRNLPDRGYAFGKALAILIVSFILWLAASANILPNSRWAIILIIALFALVSLFLFIRRRHQIASFISENRGVIIATEAIFLLSFVLYAVVHAYNPDILHTEKPMDFAFLNAILRSEHFPPHDPWLSGHNLNYYYFGHLMMATLTKLAGTDSSVTFNLYVALIFALTAIGAFSIVYNLVRLSRGGFRAALGLGLAAAGFLLILGNLEGVLELLYAHGLGSDGFWNWVGINGLDSPYHSGHWYPDQFWWWWRASRVIPPVNGIDTIAEFPFFGFLLGEPQSRLLSLPFILLVLALSLNILNSKEPIGLAWLKRNPLAFVIMIVCLGALGFIHSWDLPPYTFIFLGAILMQAYLRRDEVGHRWWKGWGALSLITVVGIFLLYLPFYLNLESPFSGISPWHGPDTRAFHYFIIWGLFLFIGVSFVLAQIRSGLKSVSWRNVGLVSLAVFSPLIVWAIVVLATGGESSIWGKLGHLAPLLILLAIIALIAVQKLKKAEAVELSLPFALLLFFTGILLTVGCELFYMNDIFGNRLNTLFRFYYQSWVLLAIASAFSLYYLYRHWRVSSIAGRMAKASWWCFLALLIIGSSLYPIAATWSRTNAFSASPTLNGLAFLERSDPSEAEAIAWLKSYVKGAPVIVEAVGGDYSMYGRVSECTGLPTILGWEQHQWVWRGSDQDTRGRREDVDRIYESEELDEVEALLEKYDVTYVYVGRLEREKYGSEVSAKFQSLMDVAFDNDGVIIYRVRE